jgi:addiction module RelE/StbE family toxin
VKKIVFSKPFRTAYRDRIAPNPQFVSVFHRQMKIFIQDPTNPVLYDHELKEELHGYRAFSITYTLRVVYMENPKSIVFVDIGTHAQVYQ